MTHELEIVLRDTLSEHAEMMDDRQLIGPVRVRAARVRRRKAAAAGVAVLVVLAGLGGVQLLRQDDPRPAPDVAATIPADWRYESMAGVQIRVPAHWTENNVDCGMDQGPTVVKPGYMVRCAWVETAAKEIAMFAPGVNWPNEQQHFGQSDTEQAPAGLLVTPRQVTVSGQPATRADFRLPDGRYAGFVRPAGKFTVTVRTLTAERTRLILDSVEVITVDPNGCPVDQPKADRPPSPAGAGAWFAPPATSSVLVCGYGQNDWTLIDSAVRTDGALVAELNRARPGHNPTCTTRAPTTAKPELVMHFRDRDGATLATAFLRLEGCVNRGFDNGRSRVHVDRPLMELAMKDMFRPYGYSEDLLRAN